MFGLVYTAIVGLAKTIRGLQIIIEDENNKNNAIKKGDNTYLDYRGAERLCSTGEYVRYERINGDRCMTGNRHRIIENYSQKVRNKENEIYKKNKELAIKNGNTVYYTGWEKIYGYKTLKTYRDIQTNEKYCCLRSRGKHAGKLHYRRVKDGLFVRLADCEIKKGDILMDKEAIKANEYVKNGGEIKYLFTDELGMDLSVPEYEE